MDKKLVNKLNKLIIYLEDVVQVLKEIVAETEEISSKAPQPNAATTMEALVHELKQLSREQAQTRLESLNKRQQIAPLFRHLGSSYSEAKRPKAYVIERILQQLFDSAKAPEPLLEVSPPVPQPKVTRKIDTLVRELKQLSRKQAQIRLESLNKRQQIEPLFRHLGNSYSEAKRPKAYVIERILWHLFDVSK